MAGKVTFVGGGTGDARLLTMRAASVLAEAQLVVHDANVHPDILALVPESTPRQAVTTQMSPDRIGQILAFEAKAGRHAVRLTWGDPLLFGSCDVEGAAVARHGVALEIVPGIGPLVAVGAFAGIPLTRTSDVSPSVATLSVTSGHEALHDWSKLATATDVLVIVCDATTVGETARSLVFYGRSADDAVTLVENVSLPTQRTRELSLRDVPLRTHAKGAPIILVVGERAAPMPELAWLEKKPLFGKRILVTRAREQAGRTAALLRERGADPVVVPTIETKPPSDPAPLADATRDLGAYGWVVLTSPNGAERLWEEIRRQGKDARAFGAAKIAAIGPGTAAALERFGLTADLVPKEHKGENLAAELLDRIGGARPRILLARAEVARDVVPDTLRDAGCRVDVVAAYRTTAPPRELLDALVALFEGGEIDAVTFTSSSTVDHLCDALDGRAPALLASTRVASIGPVTTQTARKRGLRVDVTASEYTIGGLVAAIESFFELSTTGTRSVVRV